MDSVRRRIIYIQTSIKQITTTQPKFKSNAKLYLEILLDSWRGKRRWWCLFLKGATTFFNNLFHIQRITGRNSSTFGTFDKLFFGVLYQYPLEREMQQISGVDWYISAESTFSVPRKWNAKEVRLIAEAVQILMKYCYSNYKLSMHPKSCLKNHQRVLISFFLFFNKP